jgi:hypothetical protein
MNTAIPILMACSRSPAGAVSLPTTRRSLARPASYTRGRTHSSPFHTYRCNLHQNGVTRGDASQRETPPSPHRGQPKAASPSAASGLRPKPLSRAAQRPQSERTDACAKKRVPRLSGFAAAPSANRGPIAPESKPRRLLQPCTAPPESGFPWRPPLAASLYLGSLTTDCSKLTLARLERHEEGINTLLATLTP